jgi:hypothetical protein
MRQRRTVRVFLMIGLLALALVGIGLAGPALAVSCVNAGDIGGLPSGCDLGPLHFGDFVSSVQGMGSATIFLSNAPFTFTDGTTQSVLGIQIGHSAGLVTGNADILFGYHVSAAPNILMLGASLGNGGTNVTVNERVCGQAFVGNVCGAGLLANMTAGPNQLVSSSFTASGDEFILKDMQFAGTPELAAFLSDLSNGHQFLDSGPTEPPLEATPEPHTLLLFGSSMAGLGFFFNRRKQWNLLARR